MGVGTHAGVEHPGGGEVDVVEGGLSLHGSSQSHFKGFARFGGGVKPGQTALQYPLSGSGYRLGSVLINHESYYNLILT